jgi:hypothetical protein
MSLMYVLGLEAEVLILAELPQRGGSWQLAYAEEEYIPTAALESGECLE